MSSTLTFRPSESQRKKLERRAASLEITVSEFVRELLDRALDDRPLGERVAHVTGFAATREKPGGCVGRRHSETELAQVRNLVLDTGPVVALLDANDAEHARSREALADFRGELWTTCAVITEIMHLLGRYTLGPRTVVEFVAANRLRIEGCGDLNTLKTRKICTLDRRGFMTYRTLDGKRFTVIP